MQVKNETRQEILHVAEQLFEEYGYDKTTYQMISDALGISKSMITYHFKSKPLLVNCLFEEYLDHIDHYIQANSPTPMNSYLYLSIQLICLYREVLSNERKKRLFFHEEIFKLWAAEKLTLVEDDLQKIVNEFNTQMTKEDIHLGAVQLQGAKQGLFNEIVRNPEAISVYQFCQTIAHMYGTYAKLDELTILRNLSRAHEFLDSHVFPTNTHGE